MESNILRKCNEGKISFLTKDVQVAELAWNENPTFAGVALKHLITGKDTEGKFSCHIVRVNAGCEIGEHIHEGKWELHEVLEGCGKCIIGSKQVEYKPGIMAVIPADITHKVRAANENLYMFAKFIPALL